jgi:hypothetical protein
MASMGTSLGCRGRAGAWRRPGDQILVDLPDGQVARCRIVNITDDGTIQVVPEHEVVITDGASL